MTIEPVKIHNKPFYVEPGEFEVLDLPQFQPMKIKRDVAPLDREIAFLAELTDFSKVFTNIGNTHGGYVPITLRHIFNIVSIPNKTDNIRKNMEFYNMKDVMPADYTGIVRIDPMYNFTELPCSASIILSDDIGPIIGYTPLQWFGRAVYVHNSIFSMFSKKFKNYINGSTFTFDNLVNLLIMVKDAGDGFREVLRANIPHIDHWTILDTGSTDNTIAIIKEELKDVPGKLYQEPFINFRDSRNRLLDLAGKKFAFNIMLDDTYVLQGRIREFLTVARGDDEFMSLSINIKDSDIMYSSNRITKPENCLKYVYTIHEIIETNYNGCIPFVYGYIEDRASPYMKNRTNQRKKKDLELLFEELSKNPSDPRLYYYIAETYLCLENWEEAYKYYELRVKFNKGFEEETQDALYKMAVIAQFNLGHSWDKCQQLYMNCYEFNPFKPEAVFMIGKTLADMEKIHNAYLYLKKAFEIGRTSNTMNNRIKISNYYVPYYLLPVAEKLGDTETVEKCKKMLEEYKE